MHGRDEPARKAIFDLLRRIGLEPLEWDALVRLTGAAAPFNGDVVAGAFSAAQAVVVLLTPDDVGFLHPELRGKQEREDDRNPTGQPRLNVLLEAGMALQSHPRRTLLVEIGHTRQASDLAGRNAIRLDGSAEMLHSFANRLQDAGCSVRLSGSDWLDPTAVGQLAALDRVAPLETHGRRLGGLALLAVREGGYEAFRIRGERLEHRRRDRRWLDWEEFGRFDRAPIGIAAISTWPKHGEIFVLLESGEVVHRWWWKATGWDSFYTMGKPFGEEPAKAISAASREEGHQEVFVEAMDGRIAHLWYTEGEWRHSDDPTAGIGDGWWQFSP
jgi:predicted nucleotide-binding protein with TIR-like domain